MVALSFFSMKSPSITLLSFFVLHQHFTNAFTGSQYALDTEYSGANFFDGWDFFTGRDPTGGFVTYYSRSSSQLKGLIHASDTGPAYMGVDYINFLPITPTGRPAGAGRPSVRISSQRSWTHGLFIGDFNHAPTDICGTWPAFWTLGPEWPNTGEVDIMEGVNKMVTNAVALHTNTTCKINSTSSSQLGVIGNTDCAYYPDYNVGCGVVDNRPASYSEFNAVGGGVYAMQWTSEYIRVWFFPRNGIPQDIVDKTPNPSNWGLPAADMMGPCDIDQHFQQHKIVFDTTFCGEYAGNPYVWNSTVNSCVTGTGYATCDAYVANHPEVFREAHWGINYVRVYQLVDPDSPVQQPQYIASLQPASSAGQWSTSTPPAPSPTTALCPGYNYTTIQNGGLTYEVMCSYDPPGPDIPPPYPGYKIRSLDDCIAGCTYYNTVNETNLCGAVAYDASIPFCYFKSYIDAPPKYRPGFAGARLIYYGYPQITDDPRSQTPSTSTFVEIIPTPQSYRPELRTSFKSSSSTSLETTSVTSPVEVPPAMGTGTSSSTAQTANDTAPTVSFSGTASIPVTDLTPSSQTTTVSSSSTSYLSSTKDRTSSTTIEPTVVVTSRSTTTVTLKSISSSLTTILQTTTTSTLGSSETPDPKTPLADLPGPMTVASFRYNGCQSASSIGNKLTIMEDHTDMTIEGCVGNCLTSYYAGIHGSKCYCVNAPLSTDDTSLFPDSSCDILCPGDPTQRCGGLTSTNNSIATETTVEKLQPSSLPSPGSILLTLYRNMALLDVSMSSTVKTLGSTNLSTTTSDMLTPTPTALSYNHNSTATITVTAVTTTWVDVCHVCPGFTTRLATIITIPCTMDWSEDGNPHWVPLIPMMTTTRHCNCGLAGAASIMTVTVPDAKQVSSLEESAQMILANQQPTKPPVNEKFSALVMSHSILPMTARSSSPTLRTLWPAESLTITPPTVLSMPVNGTLSSNATFASPALSSSAPVATNSRFIMPTTFASTANPAISQRFGFANALLMLSVVLFGATP